MGRKESQPVTHDPFPNIRGWNRKRDGFDSNAFQKHFQNIQKFRRGNLIIDPDGWIVVPVKVWGSAYNAQIYNPHRSDAEHNAYDRDFLHYLVDQAYLSEADLGYIQSQIPELQEYTTQPMQPRKRESRWLLKTALGCITAGLLFMGFLESQNQRVIPPVQASELQTEHDSCDISPMYPPSIQQWCDLIDTYAAENGLDPNLVAAVMLQESAGKPDAYSKSGAVGLLQVMPRDGLAASFMCINGPCFADRPSMAELLDPETNVSYGSNLLSGLIRRNGNIRDGLMAYGPKDVGYHYADIVLGIFSRHQ